MKTEAEVIELRDTLLRTLEASKRRSQIVVIAAQIEALNAVLGVLSPFDDPTDPGVPDPIDLPEAPVSAPQPSTPTDNRHAALFASVTYYSGKPVHIDTDAILRRAEDFLAWLNEPPTVNLDKD